MLYGIDLSHEHENYEPPFRGASPVQLAHNEAMRQHQKALRRASASAGENAALLALPNVKKVSSVTLGSPFNEQQQQQQAQAQAAAAFNANHHHINNNNNGGTAGVGVQTVPYIKQPVPNKKSSKGRTLATTNDIGKGRPDKVTSSNSRSKHVFPSDNNHNNNKADTSMNSSNMTLNGAGAGKHTSSASASRSKKPPVSNARYTSGAGTMQRNRKMSDASEKSVKKDDLLDRLADALK